MAAEPGAQERRQGMRGTAKAFLLLPLLLGACVDPQPPGPGADPLTPSSPRSSPSAMPPSAAPESEPQDPAPAGTASAQPAPAPDPDKTAASPPPMPEARQALPMPEAGRAPARHTPIPTPSRTAAAPRQVTAYYVLLDDGGSNGVRFGCNDSLVGLESGVTDTHDPLPAAMRALLDGSSGSEPPAAGSKPQVYNALAGSGVRFLSGTFDGTTVTVYLAGTLRPGGVCDVPRIEAQLTQTAVAAVDAIKAEIYVNGQPLADSLKQD